MDGEKATDGCLTGGDHPFLLGRDHCPERESTMAVTGIGRSGAVHLRLMAEPFQPPVRSLGMAKELKISALTVKKAYDNLEEEGMTVTVHGKGTYVAASNTQLMEEERRKEVEADLEAAVQKRRRCGMKEEEIRALFELIMEDEVC